MVKRILIGAILFWGFISTATYAQNVTSLEPLAQATLDQENVIELFPNPAVDFLTVKILNSKLQNVELELYSILGNRVNVSSEAMAGDQYRLDVQDLDSGYYLLVILDKETRFRETYKFLKR